MPAFCVGLFDSFRGPVERKHRHARPRGAERAGAGRPSAGPRAGAWHRLRAGGGMGGRPRLHGAAVHARPRGAHPRGAGARQLRGAPLSRHRPLLRGRPRHRRRPRRLGLRQAGGGHRRRRTVAFARRRPHGRHRHRLRPRLSGPASPAARGGASHRARACADRAGGILRRGGAQLDRAGGDICRTTVPADNVPTHRSLGHRLRPVHRGPHRALDDERGPSTGGDHV